MRAALVALLIPLAGCQQLLGIQDPSTGSGGDDDGRPDAAIDADAPPQSGDHLQFSIPNFSIAMAQRVRFNVFLVHENGQKDDVTGSAMLSVDSMDHGTAIPGPAEDTALTIDGVVAGTTPVQATYSGAAGASILATVTAKTCHPVINEFQTAGADAADEWVEIYNPCNVAVPVDNWTLDYRSAGNTDPLDPTGANMGDVLLVTLAGTMNPEDAWLYSGPDYPDPNMIVKAKWAGPTGQLGGQSGALGLRPVAQNTGTLLDSVGYGTVAGAGGVTPANVFLEGTMAAPPTTANVSDSRQPFDGADTDINGADFKATTPTTPGAFNY